MINWLIRFYRIIKKRRNRDYEAIRKAGGDMRKSKYVVNTLHDHLCSEMLQLPWEDFKKKYINTSLSKITGWPFVHAEDDKGNIHIWPKGRYE